MAVLRTYSLLALLMLSSPPTLSDVYKWVDENGRVHYSDRPQSGAMEALDVPAAPPADPHLAERRRKQRRLLEAIEQDRSDKVEAEKQARRQQASRRRDCARARDQLRMVDRHGRVYELDEAGKRRYWDAQTRSQRRTQISRYLEENCD